MKLFSCYASLNSEPFLVTQYNFKVPVKHLLIPDGKHSVYILTLWYDYFKVESSQCLIRS